MDINPPASVEHSVEKQRMRSVISKTAKGGNIKRNLPGATVKVIRIMLDRKVKSRLQLILLFGHNRLMMADFVVSSSGVVSREHTKFAQSNIHDALMARWCQILNNCRTYK